MALSSNSMRGLIRKYGPRAFERAVIWPGDTTPVYSPLHLRPGAEPSGTAAKGDLYFDSTANALMQHNGSAWEQVGASPSGDQTVAGSLTVSGAILGRTSIVDTAGAFATPIVLTAADSGKTYLLDDAAGLDFTLPAIAAAEVGVKYRFVCIVSATSNSYRLTAQAADLLTGAVWMVDFDAAYDSATRDAFWARPDVSDDLIMTMNGTTTGGKIGTDITVEAVSATRWFVSGVVGADGVIATPFS